MATATPKTNTSSTSCSTTRQNGHSIPQQVDFLLSTAAAPDHGRYVKNEYEFAGVQEYYILDPSGENMHFYERTSTGTYIEMQPDKQGVIHSNVLPGFQFRYSDLKRQHSLESLAMDDTYRGYVLLRYQAAAARAETERQRAEEYAAKLRELWIDLGKP